MANPWASLSQMQSPSSYGSDPVQAQQQAHQASMAAVMQAPGPAPAAQKKGFNPWSMLNPMRAIEKDPLLATATGNKWTPVDPAFGGGRNQSLGIGSNSGFNMQAPDIGGGNGGKPYQWSP